MTAVVETAGGLAVLADLERSGAITPVSLRIDDPDFPYERWAALGAYLGEIKSRSSFYLGDWLNFGEGFYPDRYEQAGDATGLNYETLTNYASVCRKVARSRRRDPEKAKARGLYPLSFGHHAEVSKLPPAEQTQWLVEAENRGWKRSDLRAAIRGEVSEAEPTVLPAEPLSANAISDAAGALFTTRRTLEKVANGEDVARDLPRAVRAIERAGATLRAAAEIPTLREIVVRLIAESESGPVNGTSLVLTATLDELRTLVGKEEPE